MGYKVPDWRNAPDEETKFKVDFPDGRTFWPPKVGFLNGEQAERMGQADEVEGGMYAVLDEICPGLGSAWRLAPNRYFLEFLKNWHKDSDLEPGESSDSSGSSESTGSPSDTTA